MREGCARDQPGRLHRARQSRYVLPRSAQVRAGGRDLPEGVRAESRNVDGAVRQPRVRIDSHSRRAPRRRGSGVHEDAGAAGRDEQGAVVSIDGVSGDVPRPLRRGIKKLRQAILINQTNRFGVSEYRDRLILARALAAKGMSAAAVRSSTARRACVRRCRSAPSGCACSRSSRRGAAA
jgi:hypothetical protein